MTTFFIDCPAKNAMTADRAGGRLDAARQVRADGVRPRVEGGPPRIGRRRGRTAIACCGSCCSRRSTRTHPARYPVIGYLDVLNGHDQPDDHRLLPRALRAEQSGVRGRRRREDATGARRGGQAVRRHAAGLRNVRPVPGRARAGFAARGGPRDGRRHLRHGVRLADGQAVEPRSVRARRGGVHPRRGRKLAAVRAAAQSSSSSCWGSTRPATRRITSAACSPSWPSAGPRRGKRPRTGSSARSTGCATSWSAPRSWPRPRSRRRPSWSSAGRPSQQMADSLGRNMLSTGDPLFDKAYVEDIQKVTAEQVRDVARRYFVPQRLNRVIIAPPGGAPKPAGNAAEGGRGQDPPGPAPQRPARAAETRRPPADGQHPGLRARRLAGRRRGDGRPLRLVGRDARPGHRRRIRPGRSPSISTRSAGRLSMGAGPKHDLRQRHDAARRFPRRGGPVCRVLHPSDISRRRSSRRSSGSPSGRSPAGPTIRSRRSASSSTTTCRPTRPIT